MLLALLLFAAGIESKTLEPGIPLTIVHGARPGPTLALIAGNHGYEYPPILALQRLRAELNPNTVSGTVLMVHVANVPGFLGRSLFANPVDGKNLNRVYPGKADGTLSERIAHTITKEVIEKSDALIDLHAGDGNESLRPYAYQEVTGNEAMDKKIAALVSATLFEYVVIDRDRPADPANAVYCSNTAITRGKPAVTVESGYLGTSDHDSVDRLVKAVENVMRYMGMLPGRALKAENPVFLDPVQILPSPATGIFYAHVDRGSYVEKGTLLAHITDYFGQTIGEVRAPFAGIVLYIIGTPPVNQGNPAAFIGAVRR